MSLGKKRLEDEGTGGAAAAEIEVEKDDDERELEKLENNDPEMLRICIIILEQLDNFKVRVCLKITNFTILIPCVRIFITLLLLTLHLLAIMCVYILDPQKAAEREELQQQMESYGDLLFELFDKVESSIYNFKVCVYLHLSNALFYLLSH
jgi:hypothetical protein